MTSANPVPIPEVPEGKHPGPQDIDSGAADLDDAEIPGNAGSPLAGGEPGDDDSVLLEDDDDENTQTNLHPDEHAPAQAHAHPPAPCLVLAFEEQFYPLFAPPPQTRQFAPLHGAPVLFRPSPAAAASFFWTRTVGHLVVALRRALRIHEDVTLEAPGLGLSFGPASTHLNRALCDLWEFHNAVAARRAAMPKGAGRPPAPLKLVLLRHRGNFERQWAFLKELAEEGTTPDNPIVLEEDDDEDGAAVGPADRAHDHSHNHRDGHDHAHHADDDEVYDVDADEEEEPHHAGEGDPEAAAADADNLSGEIVIEGRLEPSTHGDDDEEGQGGADDGNGEWYDANADVDAAGAVDAGADADVAYEDEEWATFGETAGEGEGLGDEAYADEDEDIRFFGPENPEGDDDEVVVVGDDGEPVAAQNIVGGDEEVVTVPSSPPAGDGDGGPDGPEARPPGHSSLVDGGASSGKLSVPGVVTAAAANGHTHPKSAAFGPASPSARSSPTSPVSPGGVVVGGKRKEHAGDEQADGVGNGSGSPRAGGGSEHDESGDAREEKRRRTE